MKALSIFCRKRGTRASAAAAAFWLLVAWLVAAMQYYYDMQRISSKFCPHDPPLADLWRLKIVDNLCSHGGPQLSVGQL